MLTQELKELYVLVTRAKQRLLIYDTNSDAASPFNQALARKELVRQEPLTASILDSFAVNSTPEEWLVRARDLVARGNFKQAEVAFWRAGYADRPTHPSYPGASR